jgi:hypothetical protein
MGNWRYNSIHINLDSKWGECLNSGRGSFTVREGQPITTKQGAKLTTQPVSNTLEKIQIPCLLQLIEPLFFGRPSPSLVIILTELSFVEAETSSTVDFLTDVKRKQHDETSHEMSLV